MRGSEIESVLVLQYPTTVIVQFDLQDTWSWIRNQYQWLPKRLNGVCNDRREWYLVVLIKAVIHESSDNWSFPYSLVSKEDELILGKRSDVGCSVTISGRHIEAKDSSLTPDRLPCSVYGRAQQDKTSRNKQQEQAAATTDSSRWQQKVAGVRWTRLRGGGEISLLTRVISYNFYWYD